MRISRRTGAVAAAVVAAVGLATLVEAPNSGADNGNTLTVVGTSDVYDSGLIQNVIKPDFEAAHPGITLNYISKGTGAAIAYAEGGTASALVVHAASLENQFVAGGYSLEKYGRALFWGDYVLLGPVDDPAGVGTSSPHDIVGAFAKIAAAGAAHNADFVSRGGTPGTTVQEHAIWALTSGVDKCAVPAGNGGGSAPVSSGSAQNGAACGDTDSATNYPSWYHYTGLNQAANVQNANACPSASYPNATNGSDCYVFTDRGTYQNLKDQGLVGNLKILVRNNAAAAPGGDTLLVNSFHGYAINPDAVPSGSQINTAAAKDFLDFITSPGEQAKIGAYLDTDGSVFIPSAAPSLEVTTVSGTVTGNASKTIAGRLANVVPGTPKLAGVTITLKAATGTGPKKVIATTVTDSSGRFSFGITPRVTRSYTVSSPAIDQIVNGSLSLVFGDLLQPTSTSAGAITVAGKTTIKSSTRSGRTVTIKGTIAPAAWGSSGHLSLYRAKPGGAMTYAGQRSLTSGATSFSKKFKFPKGTWTYQLRYINSGFITPGISTSKTAVLP